LFGPLHPYPPERPSIPHLTIPVSLYRVVVASVTSQKSLRSVLDSIETSVRLPSFRRRLKISTP
jgi:hypothetical protein